jgi:glycyl-tRNA synthetase beta chain
VLNSELRLPVREAVADWYRTLKTYVAPGRGVYVSAPRTTGWFGIDPDEPDQGIEPYLEELEAALVTGAAWVIEVDEDRPVSFDRSVVGRRAPTQPVIYSFRAAREVAEEVTAFMVERLKVLLRGEGARHDLVDAVFALGDDDLVRIVRRVEALERFLGAEDGANLLAAYKRASNILAAEAKKGELPTGEPSSLAGAPREEQSLLKALAAAEPKVEAALAAEDFAAAMRALSDLRAPVDAFFEKVLVNAEVAAERANRLKLLGAVRALMAQAADFSQVSG